jgi:hypothetical protein
MKPRDKEWENAVAFSISWDLVSESDVVTRIFGFLTGQAVLPARSLAGAVGQLIWEAAPPGGHLGVFAAWKRRYARRMARVVPADVYEKTWRQPADLAVLPCASEEQLVGIFDAVGLIAGTVFAVVSDQGSEWARKYFREPELYIDLPGGWYPVAGMGYQHDILAVIGRLSVEEVRRALQRFDLQASVVKAPAAR